MITLKWGGTRVCGRRRYAPHQGQPRSSPRASAQLPNMQARTLWAPRETQAGLFTLNPVAGFLATEHLVAPHVTYALQMKTR